MLDFNHYKILNNIDFIYNDIVIWAETDGETIWNDDNRWNQEFINYYMNVFTV